jgi:hypothetical protein
MSSYGTDVMGVAARPNGLVGRCVGIADSSLSLSLSLRPVVLSLLLI